MPSSLGRAALLQCIRSISVAIGDLFRKDLLFLPTEKLEKHLEANSWFLTHMRKYIWGISNKHYFNYLTFLQKERKKSFVLKKNLRPSSESKMTEEEYFWCIKLFTKISGVKYYVYICICITAGCIQFNYSKLNTNYMTKSCGHLTSFLYEHHNPHLVLPLLL